jgi:hypothetical protein
MNSNTIFFALLTGVLTSVFAVLLTLQKERSTMYYQFNRGYCDKARGRVFSIVAASLFCQLAIIALTGGVNYFSALGTFCCPLVAIYLMGKWQDRSSEIRGKEERKFNEMYFKVGFERDVKEHAPLIKNSILEFTKNSKSSSRMYFDEFFKGMLSKQKVSALRRSAEF